MNNNYVPLTVSHSEVSKIEKINFLKKEQKTIYIKKLQTTKSEIREFYKPISKMY